MGSDGGGRADQAGFAAETIELAVSSGSLVVSTARVTTLDAATTTSRSHDE